MVKRKLWTSVGIALIILFAAACTMSGSKAPTSIAGLEQTQAVEAIITRYSQATATLAIVATKIVQTPEPSPLPQASPPPTSDAAAAVAATAIANLLPSATSQPTATATAGAASTPQPTLPAADPKAALSDPTWHETFDGTSTWYVYDDKYVSMHATADKRMEMTVFTPSVRNNWALTYQSADAASYYLEMSLSFSTCSGIDRAGWMISPSPKATRGYLFGIACDGRYVLWQWDGSHMTPLSNWKKSSAIQTGADKINRLGIKVTDKKLSLYVNGQLLETVTNATYKRTYFGVFVGAGETKNFTAYISELSYWAVP